MGFRIWRPDFRNIETRARSANHRRRSEDGRLNRGSLLPPGEGGRRPDEGSPSPGAPTRLFRIPRLYCGELIVAVFFEPIVETRSVEFQRHGRFGLVVPEPTVHTGARRD